jgi:nuclear pore complex protein Nup205
MDGQLQQYIEAFLLPSSQEISIVSFDSVLRKSRQYFTSILTNPVSKKLTKIIFLLFTNFLSQPNNEGARKEIQQGITSGITLFGLGQTTLTKDLVYEAIIISDMYNLNEFVALELLTTAQHAQQKMPQYPGLPRGLVAVLLYYDGRKALL